MVSEPGRDDTKKGGTRMKEPVQGIQSGVCQIWGAGQYYGQESALPDADMVIAADGGADEAAARGVVPDLVVGDFDSIAAANRPTPADPDQGDGATAALSAPSSSLSRKPSAAARYRHLPAEKDDTDMLAAVKLSWEAGCRIFQIYGGLGKRMDHTLANLNLISMVAASGGRACLYGDRMIVTAISRGSLSFAPWHCGDRAMVSVLSATDRSEGITERGLKYQVEGMTMTNLEVTGVSNEFLPDTPARIGLDRGIVYITYPDTAPAPDWRTDMGPAPTLGTVDTNPSRWLA